MGYPIIAVHVNESRRTDERIRLAVEMAIKDHAHLIGVAATSFPETFYMPGMEAGPGAMSAYMDMVDMGREHAKTALAQFEAKAASAGVSSFEKQLIEDDVGAALCLQARYSDLIVIGQEDPDEPLLGKMANLPGYVVINSGRPVLIVPSAGQFGSIGRRVALAWDGGLAASRTVAFAIPILKQAEQVQVFLFDPQVGPRTHGELPGADIATYLARHGVKVEVSREPASDDIGIGNALLSRIADSSADLLVMGGYGHSRFRETLLGGVTRTILETMTVPVLMAH